MPNKKEKETRDETNLLFIHSKCCTAHWELVFDKKTGQYHLECEKCGKGVGIKVTGPDLYGCVCEHCKAAQKVDGDEKG